MTLVLGMFVALAAPARGAMTLGQTDPAAPAGFACGSPTAYLQSAVAAGSPSYTVPAGGGVITSWSTQANANTGKDAELKVFAPTGTPGSYLVRGQEGPHILAAGVLNTFPARISVEAGNILGFYHSTIGSACAVNGVVGDMTSYVSVPGATPDPPVGSTYNTNMNDAGLRVNISAQLEPDCDNDGLGDETQDTNLSTCAPGTIPPPAPGGPTCKGKPATIVGTNGNDVRVASPGRDVIAGLGGNDTLSGLGGNDVICGGAGKDNLKGGKGKDSLLGQKGKDALKGGGGKDKCIGGKGNDTASKCEVEKSI